MLATVDTPTVRPDRIQLMGVPFDSFTPETLIEFVVSRSLSGEGGYVVTHNLDHMYAMSRDRELRTPKIGADIRVADGMPLLWASRLQGTPLPSRVAGSDLVNTLAPALEMTGRSLFLLGGDPGVADEAADVLHSRHPALKIVGTACPAPGFERDPEELASLRDQLSRSRPDFVYVALPFGKANAVASAAQRELPATWFIGVGVSLSFIAGEVSRAPTWLQSIGLEWLHRLCQEPQRLARRYLLQGLPFALRLFATALWRRHKNSISSHR